MREALLTDGVTNDKYSQLLVEQYRVKESELDAQVRFVDAGIDNFIFWSGACMKMGLPIGSIVQMLNIVADANLQKTGVNAEGKASKGTGFKSPDESIREILIQNNINMAKEK